MKIVSIAVQKGGVSKTTTAQALACGLNDRGYQTLLLDFDAQCNLTQAAGVHAPNGTIHNVLMGDRALKDSITQTKRVDIVAGSPLLSERQISASDDHEMLKRALTDVPSDYEFVIIDTPPALGSLMVNALMASDRIIIPVQPDNFSITAMQQMRATIWEIKRRNPRLKVTGALLTRYSKRNLLSRYLDAEFDKVAASMGTKMFWGRIRESISIKEAQNHGTDIFAYGNRSIGAADYDAFVTEFLNREGAQA